MQNNEAQEKPILISEIFGPTIQGEGALAGAPTVFVRTGGCDYRCAWCDSLHAVDVAYKNSWQKMTTADVLTRVYELSDRTPLWITVSGGNPALQPLGDFVRRAHVAGYKVAVETQASKNPDWLGDVDHLILSPKPPSSKMKFDYTMFEQIFDSVRQQLFPNKLSVKIVVMDETDYLWARRFEALLPDWVPFFLTPGNDQPPNNDYGAGVFSMENVLEQTRWLVARCAQDNWFRPRIIPQIHTLLWANEQGR